MRTLLPAIVLTLVLASPVAAVAGNDDWTQPQPLGPPGFSHDDNQTASVQPAEPLTAGHPIARCFGDETMTATLWYRLSSSTGSPVTLLAHATSGSKWSGGMAVYNVGTASPSEWNLVACGGGVRFSPTPGTEYLLQVGSYECTGTDDRCIDANYNLGPRDLEALVAPSNDDRPRAETFDLGTQVRPTDTRGATTEPGESMACAPTGGTTVWYRFTATDFGTAEITASLSPKPDIVRPFAAIYAGAGTTPVACARAPLGGKVVSVRAAVAPGPYLVQVGDDYGSGGDLSLLSQFVPNLDVDRDGSLRPADCNDMDAAIHPGAHDIPRNGIDEDCTDGDSHDGDGDHYSDPAAPGQPRDCDDTRAAVNPAAFDVPRDGVDEDCRDGDADYPRIQADIRHAEKGAGTRTMIKRLTVTSPPADASVTLACRGRGCRVHRLSLTARRAGVSIKLARYFRHVRLAPAATVRVAVTTPDAYGKMLRLSIRRARPPKVTWFKVDPITRKVTPW